MTVRLAMIRDGVVENVSLGSDDPWSSPEGITVVELLDDSPVGPGWTFDGSLFAAPDIEPQQITLGQVVDMASMLGLLTAEQVATIIGPLDASTVTTDTDGALIVAAEGITEALAAEAMASDEPPA